MRGTALRFVVRSNFVLISSPAHIKKPYARSVRAFFESGAGDEIRTHDILVGNEMLYH